MAHPITAGPTTTIRGFRSTGGEVLVRAVVHEVVHKSQYNYQPGRLTEDLVYVIGQLFENIREKKMWQW